VRRSEAPRGNFAGEVASDVIDPASGFIGDTTGIGVFGDLFDDGG
jgi:hypothetical protein